MTALMIALAASSVSAARRETGTITVAGPVSHGEMTTATVNPGGDQVYVFTQCYLSDGKYVYAAYSPVGSDNTATIGPLSSTLWTSGGANCTAKEGYFTRNGFGRWVTAASTSFTVQP
jgi:hypothetical protein